MAGFDQREDSETTVAPVRPRALAVETPRTPSGIPAPGWVVAYLALCVMLTFAGLVALALESRFLAR